MFVAPSNAALHWMKNANQVIKNVWNILNSGGRFVAEFGGQGNVDTLIKGISVLLYQDYGIDASFCKNIKDEEKQNLFGKLAEITKNDLFHNGSWNIDYKRIRIEAIKP